MHKNIFSNDCIYDILHIYMSKNEFVSINDRVTETVPKNVLLQIPTCGYTLFFPMDNITNLIIIMLPLEFVIICIGNKFMLNSVRLFKFTTYSYT